MRKIPSDEIAKTGFDAVRDIFTGSPIFWVFLLLLLSVGGAYLKANKDTLEEEYPIIYKTIGIASILIVLFLIWLLFSF